jgi:glutathione synthase/RimK-type ligase-like ATP-grasp enzyme
MKIALVCYNVLEKYQHQTVKDEDGPLLTYLQKNGLNIHREVWNDSDVHWNDYDIVILKAPWDYHEHLDSFLTWLDELERIGVRVVNPPGVVRWNSDKHYLVEIAEHLPVVPTRLLEQGDQINYSELQRLFSSEKLVFKPAVSAGAKHTYLVESSNASSLVPLIESLLEEQSFLVQQFAPEVQTEGEWSFLYFNGQFSHAILKKPGNTDFRVQHYFGGTIHTPSINAEHIQQTIIYVKKFAPDCLYARVDGIIRNGTFYLMELELIEPLLFLAYAHDGEQSAQNRYLTAIKSYLKID